MGSARQIKHGLLISHELDRLNQAAF